MLLKKSLQSASEVKCETNMLSFKVSPALPQSIKLHLFEPYIYIKRSFTRHFLLRYIVIDRFPTNTTSRRQHTSFAFCH